MLVIREAHLQALNEVLFRNWLSRHVCEFFPQQTRAITKWDLAERIRVAIERARSYGFKTESFAIRYVELTFTLGSDFDRDPALPWTAEILNDKSIHDPEVRIDLLQDAAIEHLSKPMERSLTRSSAWEE